MPDYFSPQSIGRLDHPSQSAIRLFIELFEGVAVKTAIRLLPDKMLNDCVPRQRSSANRAPRRGSAQAVGIAAVWLWRPLVLALILPAAPAEAQRIQFATPIETPAVGAFSASNTTSGSTSAGSTGWVPASSSRNSSSWGNGYVSTPSQGQYGQSYGAAPGGSVPGGYGAASAPNNYGNAAAPGSYPSVSYPSGSYPPGSYPSGGYPSGSYPSGGSTGSWPSAPGLLPSQGATQPAASSGASPYAGPSTGYGPPATGYGPPSAGGYAAPTNPYGSGGAMAGSPAAPYGYPGPTGSAAPGGFGPSAPYGYSGPSTPPNALLDGTVYGPPPQWDPWAPPSTAPPSLLPYDPYYSPAASAPGLSFMGSAQRFLRMLELDYVWMPGQGAKEMGINDIDASATFNIPFLYNSQTPLMITPGFGTTLFSGPSSPEATEVPPHVFDAYLESGWNPQLTQWFGGELSFRVGVHSDFKKVVTDSLRYQAKGMAVLNFSPSIKVKAGVWYLDRVHLKLLPAGGIVWIPNNDVVLQLTFPDPKIARRLSTVGTTDWWIYGRGEYGGDVWTTKTPTRGVQLFDYNDIRTGLGLEFFRPAGLHGAFEVGAAFDREVYFRNDPKLPLNPCVYLRGMLTY